MTISPTASRASDIVLIIYFWFGCFYSSEKLGTHNSLGGGDAVALWVRTRLRGHVSYPTKTLRIYYYSVCSSQLIPMHTSSATLRHPNSYTEFVRIDYHLCEHRPLPGGRSSCISDAIAGLSSSRQGRGNQEWSFVCSSYHGFPYTGACTRPGPALYYSCFHAHQTSTENQLGPTVMPR